MSCSREYSSESVGGITKVSDVTTCILANIVMDRSSYIMDVEGRAADK